MSPLEAISWMDGMIDQALAAALADGIPVRDIWVERETQRIETRLMCGRNGAPPVGSIAGEHGVELARVWMDGLELRYEGIKLGAGWVAPGGAA